MKFVVLAIALASPALAQEAAPNLPCAGLDNSVDSKQLHTNLPRRQELYKRACDENGQLSQMVKGLEDRLKSCQELGSDLQGNTHRIPVEAVVAQYKRRISEVCKQGLEANLKNMGGLCQAYGATARKATGIPARIQDMESGTNSESAPYQALAQELTGIMGEFDGHRRAADTEAKRLGSQFSDITADGKDDDLARNVRTLRGQVGSFVTFMEEQARRRLADRQQHTAQNDENGVTMRWRTNADVQKFYRNLGKCKQAVREGGDLDKFKDSVDNVLGKTMKDARQEAADLVTPLEKKAADIKPKRDELLSRAGRIRTEVDAASVANAQANGTRPPDRANPASLNPAYQYAQDNGLTYDALNSEASSCNGGRNCWNPDGGDFANPRSRCFKKGLNRACVDMP